jgi:hypothetical protein
MIHVIAISLLAASMAIGCASTNPSYAAKYCLTERGSECSSLEGQGDCQPCPQRTARAAEGNAPSVR